MTLKPSTRAAVMAFTLLASGALAHAATAAPGSVSDFRLPEGPASPTPAPQGPVAPDVPESQVPPKVPAQVPAQPTVTPSPIPTPRTPLQTTPSSSPMRQPQLPAPALPASTASTARPVATPTATSAATPVPPVAQTSPTTASTALPPVTVAPAGPVESRGSGFALGPALLALFGGLALVVALGLLGWLRHAQSSRPRPAAVPVVERPKPVQPATAAARPAAPPPPTAIPPEGMLAMDLLPLQMTMTLVNAALSWKLEVANRGGAALDGVEVAIDMISAHKDLGEDERTSGPHHGAEVRNLGQIQAGAVGVVDGVVRLPFPAIVPIWHGDLALLMPLVRLRVSAMGVMPITRVVLVGQPSPRDPATLQPFRLDLGARVYPDLARRAFA